MFRSPLSLPNRLAFLGSAVLLTLIVVTGLVSLARFAVARLSGAAQLDFGVYYLAGAILQSSNPDELFSMERLELEAAKRGMPHFIPQNSKAPYVYPPFLAVLMRPLSRLPYPVAEAGWLGLNVAAILMSMLLLVAWNRDRRPSLGMYVLVLLVVVLYTPAHSALMLGQISPLLACILSGAFVLLINGTLARHRLAQIAAGWLIGLAAIVKVFPVLLVPFLLWKRQFRAFGWAIASLVVYGVIGILGGGVSNTAYFFVSFLPSFYGQRMTGSLDYNQSFSAALVRWLGSGPSASYLSLALSAAVLLVTGVALARARQAALGGEQLDLEYGLVLSASLLIPTYVTLNYYLLLLIPLAALWFSPERMSLRIWSVLGCIALICMHSLAMWAFWRIGHFVPFGLLAVLLLWGVLAARVGRVHKPSASPVAGCP